MNTIVTFRGRNTAGILDDARANGLLTDESKVIVVSREGDALAGPSDVTNAPMPDDDQVIGELIVIANGGTTKQSAKYLFNLGKYDVASHYGDRPRNKFRVVEIQQGGAYEVLCRWGYTQLPNE